MSYKATITSRISQFGYTEITARFEDDAGIMPTTTRGYTWQKPSVTNAEILAARDIIIDQLIAEYNQSVEEKARYDKFIEFGKMWLDNKIQEVTAEYLTTVENSNLTENQKDLARRVTFEWRLNR